ncbi:MAG TPA: aminoacyl-tRNA hydrolase [Streptosporangiaceae bacterium]|nr:aminoacyl-tRNA hydrolase [Streptosporangiaceae bacterium]
MPRLGAGLRAFGRAEPDASGERWLIVGLGNPGSDYSGNRHNAGYAVADELAARIGDGFRRNRHRMLAASGKLAGHAVTVAKPMSYMNLSGGPVASCAAYHKIPAERIIVVHDEIDLPFGAIRLKCGGGDAGHNGVKSVASALRTAEFNRVRIGVGRPQGRRVAADHVLGDFTKAERQELPLLVGRAADAVEALLDRGLATAQNEFHASPS